MTPIVPPEGPTSPFDRFGRTATPVPPHPVGPEFAKVFDLSAERARRLSTPAIPPEVLQEMTAARRVLDALDAQGHELRFELEAGRVRAELRSVDGSVVRQVPLAEAIDVGGDPTPAA
jgi:hypothetical protein